MTTNWMKQYEKCRLCPRECGVNRIAGERGFCGQTAAIRAGRAGLHLWEEPCISGTRGSGTVFFSGCSMRCAYCQNYKLSRGREGEALDAVRLYEIFLELQEKGAHNINLVTAAHFAPHIVSALRAAKREGLGIPVVYNSSGYESVDTLRMLEGLVDVYLPDFKYYDDEYAARFSFAPRYREIATAAIDEMLRQVGEPRLDGDGLMQKGVIVRHLLLPGLLYDTRCAINYLHERYGDRVYLSLMNQYTPTARVRGDLMLGRTLPEGQYDRAVEYALSIGVKNGFIQEGGTVSESFIPVFDGTGIYRDRAAR